MLSKILGVISILAGILWIIKPLALRERLKKKINRKLRWIVYGFIMVFGFLIIVSVFKAPGLLYKIVGMIGMIIAIKGILLITSKTSDKMFDWLATKPLGFFRIWGCIVLAMGIMLFLA